MSCGAIAMIGAGVRIENYDAYEIDKYAIKTSQHNFPFIKHHGNVFEADFTEHEGVDYLIGGSPCFTKGHLVLTSEGYKDISDVQVGDMVLTHKNRYMPVLRTYERDAETYELYITGFGKFVTTENHPFYTTKKPCDLNPTWTKASEMDRNTFCGMHINIAKDIGIDCKLDDDTLIFDNILWKRFISGNKTGFTQNVFNIEVEEDQSYTVNNCIVHNCTFWSIAQKNNRETEASGLGWELFSQYVRALNEAKPKFFIYENNKSMSAAIRKSITDTFGFEPICINSALVSAQNRQRLYWVGKRNEDGTYSKVDVDQPENRGILLRDILDNAVSWQDKSYAYTTRCQSAIISDTLSKHRHTLVAECVALGKELSENEMLYMVRETQDGRNHFDFGHYHDSSEDKSKCITATVAKGVPYNVLAECVTLGKGTVRVGSLPRPNGELSDSQGFRIYDIDGKAVNIKACASGAGGKTGLYAIPIEWDDNGIPTKATSCSDGKNYTVYYVHDGSIEIKGRSYPIKLKDGYYIIRKLTVSECMRLQTVPDWYDFSVVSNAQAYKMLGNGWTCDVITHLINATLKG